MLYPAILKAMTTIYPSKSTASYDSIKLGIDAHAQYYWVSRQVDGATPQPVQKMTYDELMLFVVKQQKLTGNVVTCYEEGVLGFHLHRRLEELGIKNYVAQPQGWDVRTTCLSPGLPLVRFGVAWRTGRNSRAAQIFVQNSIQPSDVRGNHARRPER